MMKMMIFINKIKEFIKNEFRLAKLYRRNLFNELNKDKIKHKEIQKHFIIEKD